MATPDGALRDLPDVVARVLDDFVAAAREAFGDDLVSVVLFGSAAEGALRVERSLHEEQLVSVVAEAAAPLRTAAAAIVELEGGPALAPKEALRRLAPTLRAPGWETTLARVSEARETRALAPGVAGETTLALADLAQRLRARLAPLG